MRRKKYGYIIISALMMSGLLTGCSGLKNAESSGTTDTAVAAEVSESGESRTSEKSSGSEASDENADGEYTDEEQFTDRDNDPSYEEKEAVDIILNGTSIDTDSSNVDVSDGKVTIKAAGVYVITGTLENGQIVVDAADDDKVQIVLNGVEITNSESACIYVKNADKVFLTLADGTRNSLEDTSGSTYTADGDENIDGVIYSKDDITLNGSGSLTVKANYKHAIVGKDDLKITGGTYDITAAGKGVAANDSIRINGGDITISSTDDALHTSNGDEAGKGYIYISGGDLAIKSQDDGVHAERELYINGGTINVAESKEGLEGSAITINDGDIDILASDDGLNATGTSDSGSMDDVDMDFGGQMFGGRGGGNMDPVDDAVLTVNGGDIYVNASGDGLDSNGYLYVNGGTVVVDGPENDGNGALDTGYTAVLNGGEVIAVGASGMAETFSTESSEYSILYNFSTVLPEGTEVQLIDSSGNTVCKYTLNKTASSVVFGSSMITEGTYTIKAGDTEGEITVNSVSTGAGETGGMGGRGMKDFGDQGGLGMQDSEKRGGHGMGRPGDRNDFEGGEELSDQ